MTDEWPMKNAPIRMIDIIINIWYYSVLNFFGYHVWLQQLFCYNCYLRERGLMESEGISTIFGY